MTGLMNKTTVQALTIFKGNNGILVHLYFVGSLGPGNLSRHAEVVESVSSHELKTRRGKATLLPINGSVRFLATSNNGKTQPCSKIQVRRDY